MKKMDIDSITIKHFERIKSNKSDMELIIEFLTICNEEKDLGREFSCEIGVFDKYFLLGIFDYDGKMIIEIHNNITDFLKYSNEERHKI